MSKPLPELLRPTAIEEIVGQSHLLGEDGALTKLLNKGHLPSLILWGPPGVGKTTLAYILAKQFDYDFLELSGVEFSVKALEGLRERSKKKQGSLFNQDKTASLVFIDEIHRLNKAQQAQLLPYVERGEWVLIGATTENPSFEIISPLLSRSQVLVLQRLEKEDIKVLISRGAKELQEDWAISDEGIEYLSEISNGDGRLLLNAVQATYEMFGDEASSISREKLAKALGNLHLVYDKHGEEHFDTISALHKSMRGSDPNASVYYLARMLEGGEDPLYIARRCVRFAAEDIGNADPMALVLANAAFDAVHKIGMPESDVILTQLVSYLANAPKSNEAYLAYGRVKHDIREYGNLPIPMKLRNAPTKLMQELGYGKEYKYAHDYSEEDLKGEGYLPDKLKKRDYFAKKKKV